MTDSDKTPKNKYAVVPYDPIWPKLYLAESSQLRKILKNILIEIHHVGSTAVPNLSAKPVIDMLIIVTDIQVVDEYNKDLFQIGYEPRGEYGIVGRRYFVKKNGHIHISHIHMYQADHPEVKHLLLFRDFLIAHPERAQAYQDLKISLSKNYINDGDAYRQGKDKCIKDFLEEAKKW